MSKAALHITRTQINRWFFIQAIVTFIATILFFLLQNLITAQSILIGGLLCMLPQWLFARLWLAYYKASAAPQIVKMFYIGELIKLALTGCLFVLALKYLPINPLACFGGFVIAQIAFWVAPLVFIKKSSI